MMNEPLNPWKPFPTTTLVAQYSREGIELDI